MPDDGQAGLVAPAVWPDLELRFPAADQAAPPDAAPAGARPERRWTLLVVAGFAVSRLAYAALGVRFRWAHAVAYWQFIDRPILRDHLAQSLWYDHLQPPGLNLLWGVALKISYDHPERVLWPVFLAVGLATALVLQRLLVELGVSARTAAIVAVVWVAMPTSVLVESYLLYTPLEILALLVCAWLLIRVVRSGRGRDLGALFAVAGALALTRTLFHLVWLLGLLALVVVVRRDRWRAVLAAAAIPLLLVVGWYVKNLVLFDTFGTSTWLGVNLSRVTVAQLAPAERRRLVADGSLSRYAAFPAFTGLEEMKQPGAHRRGPGAGVPLLDQRRTSVHYANLHQRDYLEVNQRTLHDALWVVRHRPGTYARGVSRSWAITFDAPSAWFGYGGNVHEIPGPVAVERTLLGAVSAPPAFDDPALGRWSAADEQWVVVLAYLLVAVAVPLDLVRRRAWRRPRPVDVAVGFLWANVLFIVVATTALELGENNRFRSVADPLVLVLVSWLASRWWTRRGARRRPPAAAASGPSARTSAARSVGSSGRPAPG
ncbi:MAG: hypothetical protein JWM05_3673 [Acidimicrobiales bacterium]|nr:hypothetical protein [Acidimicrobiales bacterium]